MKLLRRCYAEINLDNLEHNYRLYQRKLTNQGEVIAIIKANAYGHGAVEVARTLSAIGCRTFGVATVVEAIRLRESGIKGNIFLLGYTPYDYVEELIEYKLVPSVYCTEYVGKLNEILARLGAKIPAYIVLDTGMARLGYNPTAPDFQRQIDKLLQYENIIPYGVFTHFSSADGYESEQVRYTEQQIDGFNNGVKYIKSVCPRSLFVHCCNSAGGHLYPQAHRDGIRLGISLYGMSFRANSIEELPLKYVMTLKTVIAMVKHVKKGQFVSYGRTFCAQDDMTLATVSIGYADGYPRCLSNIGEIWVKGKRAKVAGIVTMDQLMLDVTGLDCQIGDELTVFNGESDITVEEFALWAGTINYEVTCNVSARVPRVYIKHGQVVSVKDNTI